MSINKKQNSILNLKRLAAQRQLYSEAKKILYAQFLVSGLAIVLLGIMGNILPERYVIYITVTSIICLLVDELFLSREKESLTHLAATIQEEFDCDVLEIPKNNMKANHGSLLEVIQEKNRKYISKNNDYKLLKNWYPGIKGIDLKFGKLICMSTNCWWDQELRKRYSRLLIIISVTAFVILLVVALLQGLSLSSFIGSVFAPLFPGVVLVYKTVQENNKSIDNLNHMKDKLDEITEKLKLNKYPEEQLNMDVRSLQDMIFNNRASSPVIPDKFYFWYRDNDEVIAESTNKELIDLIEKN